MTKKNDLLRSILSTLKIGLPLIICGSLWFICIHCISWTSVGTSSASFWAGLLSNRHYGTHPIVYGVGDLRAYITGSLLLTIAVMVFWATILALGIWLAIYVYKKWQSNSQTVWSDCKEKLFGGKSLLHKLGTCFLLFCGLATFLMAPVRIYNTVDDFVYNWENFAPYVQFDYDLIPVTVTNLTTERQNCTYTAHYITVDMGNGRAKQFEIINHGALENGYHKLQIGQTIYAIHELQKDGTHKLLYLEDNLQDAKITFANYMK